MQGSAWAGGGSTPTPSGRLTPPPPPLRPPHRLDGVQRLLVLADREVGVEDHHADVESHLMGGGGGGELRAEVGQCDASLLEGLHG